MSGNVLSAGQAAMVLFGVFIGLLIARVPVAFALGLACVPILLIEPHLSLMTLAQETFNAYNSFILLAVPFFLLTANLMSIGGITDRLVALSRSMVGSWPGSLAQINVLLSVFFAGISGSSTADAASQSKIFIEAQTKEGYDLSFSIAITAVSAVLAVIIPPSILMIVWGGVLSVSIGALYLAGILPGLLIAAAQMATVHVYAKLYDYPVYPRATFRDFLCSAAQSVPALMTPFIIVGATLEPLARSVGMHPVQFAIIGIVSLAFGLVTPPYGLCLMISCAVAGVRLRYALKDTMIMLVPMILVLAAIIVWPQIPLILPQLISPEFLR